MAQNTQKTSGAVLAPSDDGQNDNTVEDTTETDEMFADVDLDRYFKEPEEEELPSLLAGSTKKQKPGAKQGAIKGLLTRINFWVQMKFDGLDLTAIFLILLHFYDFLTDISLSVSLVMTSESGNATNLVIAIISTLSVLSTVLFNFVIITAFLVKAVNESSKAARVAVERIWALGFVVGASLLDIETLESVLPASVAPMSVRWLRRWPVYSVFLHTVPHLGIQLFLTFSNTHISSTLIASAAGTILNVCIEVATAFAIGSVSDRVRTEKDVLRVLKGDGGGSSLPLWAITRGAVMKWGWWDWTSNGLHLLSSLWAFSAGFMLFFEAIPVNAEDKGRSVVLLPVQGQRNPAMVLAGVYILILLGVRLVVKSLFALYVLGRGRMIPHRAVYEVIRTARGSGIVLCCSACASVDCVLCCGVYSRRAQAEVSAATGLWDGLLSLLVAAAFAAAAAQKEAVDRPVDTFVPLGLCVVSAVIAFVRFGMALPVANAHVTLRLSTPRRVSRMDASVDDVATPSESLCARLLLQRLTNLRLARLLDGTDMGEATEENVTSIGTLRQEIFRPCSHRHYCGGLVLCTRPHGHSEHERMRWIFRGAYAVGGHVCSRFFGSLLIILFASPVAMSVVLTHSGIVTCDNSFVALSDSLSPAFAALGTTGVLLVLLGESTALLLHLASHLSTVSTPTTSQRSTHTLGSTHGESRRGSVADRRRRSSQLAEPARGIFWRVATPHDSSSLSANIFIRIGYLLSAILLLIYPYSLTYNAIDMDVNKGCVSNKAFHQAADSYSTSWFIILSTITLIFALYFVRWRAVLDSNVSLLTKTRIVFIAPILLLVIVSTLNFGQNNFSTSILVSIAFRIWLCIDVAVNFLAEQGIACVGSERTIDARVNRVGLVAIFIALVVPLFSSIFLLLNCPFSIQICFDDANLTTIFFPTLLFLFFPFLLASRSSIYSLLLPSTYHRSPSKNYPEDMEAAQND